MNSKSVRKLSQFAMSTIWAAFACSEVYVEAMRREHVRFRGSDEGFEPEAEAGRNLFVLLGRQVKQQMLELQEIDAHYQELRARQRRRQKRRDAIKPRLYRAMGEARRALKGLFGPGGDAWVLGVKGPTRREPFELWLQASEAIAWAERHELPETKVAEDYEGAVRAGLKRIGKLVDEFGEAIEAVGRGRSEVEAAMLRQREARKAFNRVYKETAHILEAQLIMAGLPTLAASVRPGVGRRGRPLKKRPRDLYPELVEQVRVEGLMAVDEAMLEGFHDGSATFGATQEAAHDGNGDLSATQTEAGNGWAAPLTLQEAARDRSEGLSTTQTGDGNGFLAFEKIETPVPERAGQEDLMETPLSERAGQEDLIETPFPERKMGLEKTETPVPEQGLGLEKIETLVPEPVEVSVNAVSKAFRLPYAVASCSRPRSRRDLRARHAGKRPEASGEPQSSLGKAKKAASDWWSRWRRVG